MAACSIDRMACVIWDMPVITGDVAASVCFTISAVPATDERELGADLDGDGVLGTARRVAFVWPPRPDSRG